MQRKPSARGGPSIARAFRSRSPSVRRKSAPHLDESERLRSLSQPRHRTLSRGMPRVAPPGRRAPALVRDSPRDRANNEARRRSPSSARAPPPPSAVSESATRSSGATSRSNVRDRELAGRAVRPEQFPATRRSCRDGRRRGFADAAGIARDFRASRAPAATRSSTRYRRSRRTWHHELLVGRGRPRFQHLVHRRSRRLNRARRARDIAAACRRRAHARGPRRPPGSAPTRPRRRPLDAVALRKQSRCHGSRLASRAPRAPSSICLEHPSVSRPPANAISDRDGTGDHGARQAARSLAGVVRLERIDWPRSTIKERSARRRSTCSAGHRGGTRPGSIARCGSAARDPRRSAHSVIRLRADARTHQRRPHAPPSGRIVSLAAADQPCPAPRAGCSGTNRARPTRSTRLRRAVGSCTIASAAAATRLRSVRPARSAAPRASSQRRAVARLAKNRLPRARARGHAALVATPTTPARKGPAPAPSHAAARSGPAPITCRAES